MHAAQDGARYEHWAWDAANASSLLAAIAIAAVLSTTGQAADTVLTLACQGTTTAGTEDAKPEPISMGIIVNFTNRTVQGFGGRGLFGEQCCVQQFLRAVSVRLATVFR